MKKILFMFLFLQSFTLSAQSWIDDDFPLNYSWKYCGAGGFSSGIGLNPTIALSPIGEPYVAFDDGDLGGSISVMKYDGNSWSFVGPTIFSGYLLDAPCIAFNPSGEPVVAFHHYDGMEKINVKKFNGNNWVNVGTTNFDIAEELSFELTPTGEPYIAYLGLSFPSWGDCVVRHLDSQGYWILVGSPGIVGTAKYVSLALDSSVIPHVAFMDQDLGSRASVKKFNGTDWEYLGQGGFSSAEARNTRLVFSHSGEAFVAFKDYGYNRKVTVMKFDGNAWGYVGSPGFSVGAVDYISLAINQSGEPYVAYRDSMNSYRATVMKYDGSNWVNIGPQGFSADIANCISLALSLTGQPFIAYTDFAYSKKVSVMRFDSVYVGIRDVPVSCAKIFPNPATDRITIEFNNKDRDFVNIDVYDLTGRKLSEFSSRGESFILDVKHFKPGMYFVKLNSGNHFKFVKFYKK